MKLYVQEIQGKGRGVLAGEDIPSGTLFESAQVVQFPKGQWKYIAKTKLGNYAYFWGEDLKSGVLALGLGSLYNHSFEPNARYIRNIKNRTIDFVALRDIRQDEEIMINYNGDPEDKTPVWFDVEK